MDTAMTVKSGRMDKPEVKMNVVEVCSIGEYKRCAYFILLSFVFSSCTLKI